MTTPLTRDQLDAGLQVLDRMYQHTFAADPGLDRPESFDLSMLLTYLIHAVKVERDLADFVIGLPDTCPFKITLISDTDFA